MTPSRPYLIRAINEWIIDNDFTPYLLADATAQGIEVPERYIENGKIVLNISPAALNGLLISNTEIMFSARFSGTPLNILVPMHAVLAIYAKENGRGMMFTEEGGEPQPPDGSEPSTSKTASRPALKVVK